RQTLVLHDLLHHRVAMLAVAVHDPREPHRLAGLELHRLRKRRVLALLHVVGDALLVVERAVLAPHLARGARHLHVGLRVLLRDRQYETVNVPGSSFSQAATGAGALAALGNGGNASAIATAPRPTANEPTYSQVYSPKRSKTQPPTTGP